MDGIPVRSRGILVALMLLLAAGLLVGGLAGSAGAADGTATETEAAHDDATIAPAAANASGNATLVVRLAAPELATQSSDRPISATELQERVEPSQSAAADRLAELPGVEVRTRFWITNAIVIHVDTDRADLAAIAAIDGVERVDPDATVSLASASRSATHPPAGSLSGPISPAVGPTSSSATYGLDLHRVPDAWAATDSRGEGARIAVLDSGVNESHPDIDLAESGWAEFDIEGDPVDSDPHDPNGHGTHVSGTATGGNASGTAIGIAPDAELYHAKVFPGAEHETSASAVIAGLQWAVENDVDVASLSVGAEGYFASFIDPIRNARSAGTVVVSSSGNVEQGSSTSPGNVHDAIGVGAVDSNGDVASFSSGETVDTEEAWRSDAPDDWPDEYVVPDVTAAGVHIGSADAAGGYRFESGTSMAAPHVAGVAALIRALEPSLSVDDVETAMVSTAVHPTGEDVPDDRYGSGWIDAYDATATATTGTVAGTVTDDAGDPVANATVAIADRSTETDETGEYSVTAASGDRDLNASAFGYHTETRFVSVEAMTTTTQNVTLDRTVDARLVSDQPAEADASEAFDVELEVAHVDELTVETTEATTVPDESVSITIDDETVAPGESVAFDSRQSGPLTVGVETTSSADGEIEFEHVFAGVGDESVSVSSGPTTVTSQDAVFEITELNAPEVVDRFGTREVNATVENTGVTGTDTVQYRVGDTLMNESEVTLDGGESTTVAWDVAFTNQPAEYTQRVTTAADAREASLTVEGDIVVDDYRDEDGEMRIQGLRAVIKDFVQQEVGIAILRSVIDAFVGR